MEVQLTKTAPNRFAGTCIKCGTPVDEMAGLRGLDQNERWRVMHKDGQCKAPATPEKPVEVDDKVMEGAVGKVVDLIAQRMSELVPGLVETNLDRLSRVAEIKVGKAPAVKVDKAHNMLEPVLTAVVAGAHPMLVGPAGSGKTTLGIQIAQTLKRKFYMEARVTSEFKLLGFLDATGKVTRTQFREAYEKGGIFLFDEVDASDPDAMTAFNAALANGHCPFPDKMVDMHKDFVAIAAGNTFGRGADRQYVGRNQLDAATLDRFVVFEVDYDPELERAISGNAEWTTRVQTIRAAIEAEKVRHIVSPRASIIGAKLLAAGMDQKQVEESVVWKGLDPANRQRVVNRMGGSDA